MIFLSIVIPVYNNSKSIAALLKSISSSQSVNFREIEIICVDDASSDNTVDIILKLISKGLYKNFANFRLIKQKINSGPAKARNVGVKYAKGKVIVFLDADVLLHKNSLSRIVDNFKNNPDLFALTGVWDKKQYTNKFFPKFKALRDWSYWINERDPKNYYYLFSTRIASIDRGLFMRLGGFDTSYKAALVEDIELTYRIAKRHAVVFDPKVIVHHEFEDFWPVAKKYFWRSFYWSKIYRERKKFDPVATTSKEALTTISAGVFVGLGILWFFGYLSNLGNISKTIESNWYFVIIGSFFFLLIHIWGVRKFLSFCYKEEGVIFAIKSFFTGIILYLMILAGAVWSYLYGHKN